MSENVQSTDRSVVDEHAGNGQTEPGCLGDVSAKSYLNEKFQTYKHSFCSSPASLTVERKKINTDNDNAKQPN